MFDKDFELLQTLVPLLIAIVAAIEAYWQHKQKKVAESVADENYDLYATESARTTALVSPGHATPDIVTGLPDRAWKMSEDTKRFLTAGALKPYEAEILKQIQQAEDSKKVSYRIFVPNGVQYEIEYGLLRQQVGNT
jgi:hypothetical protein